MLVSVLLVESAGDFRGLDPGDLLHLARVGQTGDVEDDGAEVVVGAAGPILVGLGEIVTALALQVRRTQGRALVQLRAFDLPGIHHEGPGRVLEIDDVEPALAAGRDVRIGPRELLLDLDVREAPRDVRHHVHVGGGLLSGDRSRSVADLGGGR